MEKEEKLEAFVRNWTNEQFKNTETNSHYSRSIRKVDSNSMTVTIYLDEHGYKDEEIISSYLFRDGKIIDLTKSRRSKTRVVETYIL